MRSPADMSRFRRVLEHAARVVALLLLLVLLYEVLRPGGAPSARSASDQAVPGALRSATLDGEGRPLELRFSRVPDPATRDWAGALRRAGVPLRWDGERLAGAVITVEPLVDPRGGHEVRVWREVESPAVMRDDAGELARVDGAGVTVLTAPAVHGSVVAELPGQRLRAHVQDPLQPKAVLVLARAGWEARFLLRSLEELGWSAHARLVVAPGLSVVQGTPTTPDTARHAAVIVLDTTGASQAAAIARYVRAGGGLIMAGEASAANAFSALAPGTGMRRFVSARELLPDERPEDGLTRWSPMRLHAYAATLGMQGDAPVISARRVGAGRVLQAAYEDSWRLRMEAGDGPELHRQWWAQLLSAAANAPVTHRARAATWGEHAPYAAMLDALGMPGGERDTRLQGVRLPRLPLFIAALALLLCEWFSRRLRGAA